VINQDAEVGCMNNGMDFPALWNILIRGRVVVVGVLFLTFFSIVFTGLLSTSVPIYKASSTLSFPSEGDIRGGVEGYIPEKVFNHFVGILKSREERQFSDCKFYE